jgi:hypothetical protein
MLKIIILRNCFTCFNSLLFVPILVPGDRAVGSLSVNERTIITVHYRNISNGKDLLRLERRWTPVLIRRDLQL